MSHEIYLETKRLVLTKLTSADFAKLRLVHTNPDTMVFLNGVRTEEKSREAFDKRLIAHLDKYGFTLGPVYEKSTNKFIGFAGLIHLDFEDVPELERGILLLPEFWGKGYGNELAEALTRYAFEVLKAPVLCSTVDPNNVKVQAICKKLGMTYIDTRPYKCFDNKLVLYYEAYPDWLKQHPKTS